MSDFQREPDWWQAEDGYWYPPIVPAVVSATDASAGGTEPEEVGRAPEPKGHKALFVVLGVVVVVALGAGAWFLFGTDDDEEELVMRGTFTLQDSEGGHRQLDGLCR